MQEFPQKTQSPRGAPSPFKKQLIYKTYNHNDLENQTSFGTKRKSKAMNNVYQANMAAAEPKPDRDRN